MSDSPLFSKRGLIHVRLCATDKVISSLAPKTDPQRMKNSSISFNGASGAALCEDGSIISDRLVMGATEQFKQQTRLKEKADMLFPQFLEVLQGRSNDSDVFDTIQDLIHTCSGTLDELKKDLTRYDSIGWLDQELKTWKLLYALYKDRMILQANGGVMDCEVLPLGGSEKEVIAQLYTFNSTLREYQLIVDWLEACYDRCEIGPQVGHSADRTAAWENTLFQLHRQKEIAFGNGGEIVRSLDPDAPVREKRPLHPLDEEDNMRLSKGIFAEIRQGRIDEAMALCKYCGQTWRAAILEGWRLHEDPNYDLHNSVHEKLPIEGNPRRDLWKKCAWLMADSTKYDEYTRAIAGVFCGHLDSLKALVRNSWDDLLWAYLKVQIDIRVESEIRASCLKSYHQMPSVYWNGKMSLEQIFDELSVHNDAAVRDHAASKFAVIQKYLIMDNIDELLQHIRRWFDALNSDLGNRELISPHLLRFLSHIVLFMCQIGRIEEENTADFIISAYVECLINVGDAQLVAFYTAALPTKSQVMLYSKFLQLIPDSTARLIAFKEAINAGLDVENITRHVVETVRHQTHGTSNDTYMSLQVGDISDLDQKKISALEWLTFLPTQRADLIWQANSMMRIFLADGKTECVRAVYEMIPLDSLSQIINIYGTKDNFPSREECSVKEYLSYKVYLTALDSFTEWSRLFYNPPKEPNLLNTNANFTERIASEYKEQVFRAELNRWNIDLQDQAKVSRDALFNVLLFPEKGWLIDPDTLKNPVDVSGLDWKNRQVQLKKLRSICIPEIVLLLQKLLHQSGDYQGCVKLADEIASESRQLYQVYTKHKLAELLSKMAESSLELLNSKLDPWGFAKTA